MFFLQLQPIITIPDLFVFVPPGIHHCSVDRGTRNEKIACRFYNMTSNGNRTSALLILSPTPCPFGHNAPNIQVFTSFSLN